MAKAVKQPASAEKIVLAIDIGGFIHVDIDVASGLFLGAVAVNSQRCKSITSNIPKSDIAHHSMQP